MVIIRSTRRDRKPGEICEKLRKDKDICKKPTDISQILENLDALKSFFKCSNLGKIRFAWGDLVTEYLGQIFE